MYLRRVLLIAIVAVFTCSPTHCDHKVLTSVDDIENKTTTFLEHQSPYDDAQPSVKRQKRHLLWPNGISKIVLGFLAPVETKDRVNWRTLNLGYNFQTQYVPLPDMTLFWNKFAGDMRSKRALYDTHGKYDKDLTRDLIYGAIQMYLRSQGKPARECLLKSICDAAEHPIHQGGVLEEIVHLILTPNMNEDINIDYRNARRAGEYGSDCGQLYACPMGAGLLDKFSYLV